VGFGKLLEVGVTLEGTIRHQIRGAIGRVQLRNMLTDDVAKRFPITAIATERLHQHGNARLVLDNQLQHDLVEVRAMIATITFRDVHDVLRGRLITVIAPINMKARTVEVRIARTQSQPLCGSRCNEAVEFGDSISVERIQGTTKGVIVELFGGNAGRNEAGGGLILEEPGDKIEGLIDKPQAIEHHRFDSLTYREVPHFWVLVGGLIEDVANAEFIEHASDKAEVV